MNNPFDFITVDSLLGIQIVWVALGGFVGIVKAAPEFFFLGWLISN